jgi:hypothetical protein
MGAPVLKADIYSLCRKQHVAVVPGHINVGGYVVGDLEVVEISLRVDGDGNIDSRICREFLLRIRHWTL